MTGGQREQRQTDEPRPGDRVPCRDCGAPTVTYAVLRRHKGEYALCPACSNKTVDDD